MIKVLKSDLEVVFQRRIWNEDSPPNHIHRSKNLNVMDDSL